MTTNDGKYIFLNQLSTSIDDCIEIKSADFTCMGHTQHASKKKIDEYKHGAQY